MAEQTSKQALIRELALARSEISANAVGVRRRFDVIDRIKDGMRHHRTLWIGSAALLGLLLSLRATTKRKRALAEYQPTPTQAKHGVLAGLALTGLKLGFDAAKPSIMKWAKDRAMARFTGHAATASPPRMDKDAPA